MRLFLRKKLPEPCKAYHGCQRRPRFRRSRGPGESRHEISLTHAAGRKAITLQLLVPPGRYTVAASLTGFKSANMTGIDVAVNRSTRVDLTLQVGSVSESVQVSSEAVRIDSVRPRSPPTFRRNGDRSPVLYAKRALLCRNGSRRDHPEWRFAGHEHHGHFRQRERQPAGAQRLLSRWQRQYRALPQHRPAVSRIPRRWPKSNVSTSNTSAEFGKQPGGVFNIITKSGTNDFHGSGFAYLHNEALNANTWQRNCPVSRTPWTGFGSGAAPSAGPRSKTRPSFSRPTWTTTNRPRDFRIPFGFPTPAMVGGDFSQFDSPLVRSRHAPAACRQHYSRTAYRPGR